MTATRRLALRLQQHLPQGYSKVYEAPAIFALSDWFQTLWNSYQIRGATEDKILLTPFQELGLLNTLLQRSSHKVLLQLFPTAKLLRNTWKLLCQWQLDINTIDFSQQEEGKFFYNLAHDFKEELKQRQWITSAELPNFLFQLIQNDQAQLVKNFSPSHCIIFVGFDDYYPELLNFKHMMEALDWNIIFFQSNKQAKSIQRVVYQNFEQEIEAIARSAKNAVQKKQSIGIVVPTLLENRTRIEDQFNKVFNEVSLLDPVWKISKFFNISAGLPLYAYPVIADFFQSFSLIKEKIELDTLLGFLHSPFFLEGNETLCAQLSYHLKKESKKYWDHEEVILLLSNLELEASESFIAFFEKIVLFKEKVLNNKNFSSCFDDLFFWIQLLNWPGPRTLTSVEHQVVARFYNCIHEWHLLNLIINTITFEEAIDWLKRICIETTFQPESEVVPIHIMGLLEASGQEFDQLYVTGLHGEILPALPSPNPFLPIGLQRALHMPHASSEREFIFAQSLIESFLRSANEVNFSHHLNDAIYEFQDSALIAHIPSSGALDKNNLFLYELFFAENKTATCEPLMPFPLQEHEKVQGGTNVIRTQAMCPFQAFARYRLKAWEPEYFDDGITPIKRGILYHKALETIWKQLRNQQNLKKLSTHELEIFVTKIVDNLSNNRLLKDVSPIYWEVEKNSMIILLLAWLELEKQRTDFKVLKQECLVQIHLKGLTLRAKIDRIDQSMEGIFIIDYKTSLISLSDTIGSRPKAVQLPLYCFADYPQNANGIFFAQITKEECLLRGVTSNTFESLKNACQHTDLSSLESWNDLLQYWRQTMDGLSLEFKEGHCKVEPLQPQSCKNCQLPGLCRIEKTYI
ncbi:MAG TPA: PD-(D/E)XK nuclease family protein [Gammaproteobacteria bacterium]|nr:PD-(D/E)XK nuclease family protein [Gammaproteobacteria bacterium]